MFATKNIGDVGQLHIGESLEVLKTIPSNSIDSLVTDPPSGTTFMGMGWDNFSSRKAFVDFLTIIMKECLRVLKPGAYAMVWSLTRTSHWAAWAIEDAGFEIKDCIGHVNGQSFPKNFDLSKAIDKKAGATREVIGLRHDAAKLNRSTQAAPGGWVTANRIPEITAPATEEAKKWVGFGTALKPSLELWILARKPISEKTIAENVVKWGTGGLNIDACRIPTTKDIPGRFPANFCQTHSESCKRIGVKRVRSGIAVNENRGNHKSKNVYGDYEKMQGKNCGYANEDGYETVEEWECTDGCPVKTLNLQAKDTSRFFMNFEPFYYQAKPGRQEKDVLTDTVKTRQDLTQEQLSALLAELKSRGIAPFNSEEIK